MNAQAPIFTPGADNGTRSSRSSLSWADMVWREIAENLKQTYPQAHLGQDSAKQVFLGQFNLIDRSIRYKFDYCSFLCLYEADYLRKIQRDGSWDEYHALKDLESILECSGAFKLLAISKNHRDSVTARPGEASYRTLDEIKTEERQELTQGITAQIKEVSLAALGEVTAKEEEEPLTQEESFLEEESITERDSLVEEDWFTAEESLTREEWDERQELCMQEVPKSSASGGGACERGGSRIGDACCGMVVM